MATFFYALVLLCERYKEERNMHQIDELVVGTVTNVKPYALFLQFDDGSQGLLHISEISDSYIRDIEKFGSKGDKLKVKILSVDSSNGFLRVSLKRVPCDQVYSTHSNSKRKAPEVTNEDFKQLEENLPKWIEETLALAKGENK